MPAPPPHRGSCPPSGAIAASQRADASVARAMSPGAERPLVLVVENDPIVSALLARALGGQFRVAIAEDGAIGLSKIIEEPPDLVLTDLRMPNMDGEELVREVRRHSELDGVPIMVLTAWADEDVRVRLLEHGALDFLAKPFSVAELLSRVHNLVCLKRAREMLQDTLQSRERDLQALTSELVLRKRELEISLESLRIESARAEAATRARNDFLGLMSHELMSPLSVLELGCRCLEHHESALSPEERLASIRRMAASCRRLGGTLRELLEHVRLESERLSPGRDPVDLAALAAEVLEEVSAHALEKGLELRLAVEPRLPLAHGDAHLYRLVLAHLVSNAVKFTERGSVVVSIEYRDGTHRLSVEDTGPGIPLHERSRVFEPFQHLERLSHKHIPGIGLGLTLARRAAAVLGATIEVDTRPGSGTTFILVSPARPAASDG